MSPDVLGFSMDLPWDFGIFHGFSMGFWDFAMGFAMGFSDSR